MGVWFFDSGNSIVSGANLNMATILQKSKDIVKTERGFEKQRIASQKKLMMLAMILK